MSPLDLTDPSPRYVLEALRAPACLVPGVAGMPDGEGLVTVDIEVAEGRISRVAPIEGRANGGLVLPGLIDAHTHLDKGFIWKRAPNPDGSFMGAITAADEDRQANWSTEDVRRRMDFGLRCAHAHGTVAVRTHLDSIGKQTATSWAVFDEVRADWADRIELHAVSLTSIDLVLDDGEFDAMLGTVRHYGGVLGAFTAGATQLDAGLERLFDAAERHGLDLDFHVDETADPAAQSLKRIAEVANRRGFEGRIMAGHCCSLANQDDDTIDRTLDEVARAGITVVSLPMCNLYLMDRMPGRTPRWRGITLLHEMKARGIPVMVASDNTRDPFYAYGDLDLIEVYREATRIAHLDHPFSDWPSVVARTPAAALGLEGRGIIAEGAKADLILLDALSLNELIARPSLRRTVLRNGRAIDTTLPDYAELDDLMGAHDGD